MKTKLLTLFLFLLIAFGAKTQVNLQNGLVAYYPFNGNANDESGNGNNGNVNGATLTTDRFGNVGKAYSFDGSSNSITSNTSFFNIGWDQFTVSGWVSLNDVNKISQTIFNTIPHEGIDLNYNYESTSQHNFSAFIGSYSGVPAWDIALNSQGAKKDYENNKWFHFTLIKSGLKYYLYINNILDMIISSSIAPTNTQSKITLGSNNVRPEYFGGKLDDIRIYNRALSSDEITQIYNSEKPATDLSNGLVAYYPFNGNANDESGNGNNGTVNGATLTTDRFGNVGKAYSFNGGDNNISVSKNQQILNYCSFSAWFKLIGNQRVNQYYIIDARISFGNNSTYLNVDRDLIQTLGFSYSTSVINDNNWHQIISSYDGSVTKIYLDGTLINQSSQGNLNIVLNNLRIGNSCNNNECFNGNLDDIRIYNRTLSSDEVTALYNSEKPATDLTTGLVAYYPFNGNANDESGNGNNGTVNGATLTTDRFGNVGKAYNFDGVNNYISINNVHIPESRMTYTCWIKVNEKQTNPIISKLTGSSNVEILFSTQPDGKYDCEWTINNQYYDSGKSSSAGSDDGIGIVDPTYGWDFVTFKYDGSRISFYLNGILVNVGDATGSIVQNNLPLIIGSYSGLNKFFKGSIDDIRIYNRALTDNEIKFLYSGQVSTILQAPDGLETRTKKLINSENYKTTILWKAATNAKLYEVYKNDVLIGKTFSTIYYDENPEGNYKYQVVSVNGNGKSPRSLSCNVAVSGTNTVSGYGSMAIYITDSNKQKVENALIQFTDGSTAQTLKTGFVLLKNIPYGTTKTITRIVKSGWDFSPLNGSSFSCTQSKPSVVLRYLATTTPENEPSMETFNPQYSSDLVIVSEGDITLPTFTKGQNFTLDLKIASTSEYWWNGNIRLKVIRKDVVVDKTYPTYYIAQLNDVKVPQDGKMIRFTANASQLNAEAGNYELYVEAQTKEVFRQGYFIVKKGKITTSTTNSDAQYKTDISVSDNTGVVTGTETLFAISDAIKQTTGIYEMFGNLIELDNRTILKGELGHDIIMAYGNVNVGVQAVASVNDKIQFIKDLSDIAKENDEILRSFKMMKFIIDKAAAGNPMATIFKSYIDVAESMKGAIDRISNGINDATSGMIINEHPIYLKIKKEWTGWQSYKNLLGGDYFDASEFNMYVAKAEVFSDKPGSSRFTLPIEKDETDAKRMKIRTDGLQDLQFDTGEHVYLKLTFTNKRKLIIPLSSRFVKYDGLYGAMTFVLGTNTTVAKEISEKIKIVEP
jgi:hypothetical protein